MDVQLLTGLEFGWVIFCGLAGEEELLKFGRCVEELSHCGEAYVMGLQTTRYSPIAKGQVTAEQRLSSFVKVKSKGAWEQKLAASVSDRLTCIYAFDNGLTVRLNTRPRELLKYSSKLGMTSHEHLD